MSTSLTFNGTLYSVPETGETSWGEDVSALLIALGTFAATATTQRATIRTATTSPVTIASTDYCVVCKLTVPAAVAVTLPAGTTGQLYAILDGTGDAATNNITITSNGSETINGAAIYVINTNNGSVILQYNTTLTRWVVLASNGSVSNADVAANAAIAYSKLNLSNAIQNADIPLATIGHNKLVGVTPGQVLIGSTSNILTAQTISGDITISDAGVTAIGNGIIVNADVSASAAIAYSKLNLAGSITSGDIVDGTIVNDDINASAAIARTKVASGSASHVVINDGSGVLSSESTLANTRGGTGFGTYTAGDVLYASATDTLARRGIGSSGQVLTVVAGLPAWTNASAGDAVLAAIQTFTALNTFSGGISVTGGSAANNSIWSASNVLRNRGGTSGWAVDNTSGNAIISSTDTGEFSVAPRSAISLTGATDQRVSLLSNTTSGEGFALVAKSSALSGNRALSLFSMGQDVNQSGDMIFDVRTSTNAAYSDTSFDAFRFRHAGTVISSLTRGGASTFGVSGSVVTHTFNGGIAAQSPAGNYHAFYRTTSSDTASPIILARSAIENGGEVYVNFFENATNAVTIGTEAGGIRRNAGDTTYEFYNASDLNLKNITGTYSGGLQQVVNVPVRTFSWKTSPEREHFRFIAQEVQAQIPSAVFQNSDGVLQLGESDFTPIMWNAIQELNAKIETQAAEITKLKGKNK